jgi:hypothetical protein
MRPSTPTFRLLLIGLSIFLLSTEILTAVFRAHGRPETGLFVLVRTMGWIGWLGWWYEADARQRGKVPGLDVGLWLAIAWPLVMIYRLLAPGRKHSAQVLALAVIIYLVAKIAGLAVYMLQSG